MGPTHVIAGAWSGAGVALLTGQPWWAIGVSAFAATVTAAGPLSPDMDQHGPWKAVDRLLPDEFLGGGGPLKHRGITHWPALPLIAAWFLQGAQDRMPITPGLFGLMMTAWWVLAWGLVVGWASHLVLDFVWGRAWGNRGAGVPLLGWTGYVGLGLDAGGVSEHLFRWAMLIAPFVFLIRSVVYP